MLFWLLYDIYFICHMVICNVILFMTYTYDFCKVTIWRFIAIQPTASQKMPNFWEKKNVSMDQSSWLFSPIQYVLIELPLLLPVLNYEMEFQFIKTKLKELLVQNVNSLKLIKLIKCFSCMRHWQERWNPTKSRNKNVRKVKRWGKHREEMFGRKYCSTNRWTQNMKSC